MIKSRIKNLLLLFAPALKSNAVEPTVPSGHGLLADFLEGLLQHFGFQVATGLRFTHE